MAQQHLKTVSERTTKKHLFEVLPSEPRPLYNAGWALKRYTRNFANICLTVDFDTVCFTWLVLVCKVYPCHITIPTKLTFTPRTEDFYFSKYTLICPWRSTVMRSVKKSYCRSYGHTVGHTVKLLVIESYGHTVGPCHGCLQLY